jgi:uncharacterized protein (UPF0210 family)
MSNPANNDNDKKTTPTNIKPTIRTITAFLTLTPKNFDVNWGSLFSSHDLDAKVTQCAKLLQDMQDELTSKGYEVQTIRIATNPFGEWMTIDSPSTTTDNPKGGSPPKKLKIDKLNRLERLDRLLANHNIEFCSVGPAVTEEEAKLCVDVVSQSHRFSCSHVVEAGNVEQAKVAASTILAISRLGDKPNAPTYVQGGLGNFRFCSASYCRPGIPFFPAAKAESNAPPTTRSSIVGDDEKDEPLLKFAIGLENGPVVQQLLKECRTISNIPTHFRDSYAKLLEPIQAIGRSIAKDHQATFLGIDSSMNPSLDESSGSIAAAMEQLKEIQVFGGHGTLAVAAEITKAIQSLPNIDLTGYCGLMLPLCEDTRLAELATATNGQRSLRISDLLSISSVCGVGVDTVPVAGDVTQDELVGLILDVAGLAGRWNKPLSCRVFPVPGKVAGEQTTFDSPYMVNSQIFSLE